MFSFFSAPLDTSSTYNEPLGSSPAPPAVEYIQPTHRSSPHIEAMQQQQHAVPQVDTHQDQSRITPQPSPNYQMQDDHNL